MSGLRTGRANTALLDPITVEVYGSQMPPLFAWISRYLLASVAAIVATFFEPSRRMTIWLNKDKQEQVNRKRVRRLMQVMGLEAIYPKPKLSAATAGHKVYPYLLRGLKVEQPLQYLNFRD